MKTAISGYIVSGISGALLWEWLGQSSHNALLLIIGIVLAVYGAYVATTIQRKRRIAEQHK